MGMGHSLRTSLRAFLYGIHVPWGILASFLNPEASRKANIEISICSSINITPPSTPSGPRQPAQPPIVDVAAEQEGDEENAVAVRGRGGGRRSKRIRGQPAEGGGGGGRGHPPAKRGRGGRQVQGVWAWAHFT